ncbi:ABC transporter substrate-binding protein [Actinopolymorpha pittospori]
MRNVLGQRTVQSAPIRRRAVLMGMVGLAAGAGCGNAGGGEAGGKVTLRMAWYGGGARDTKYNGILDRFQKKHPNILVKRESAEWGDYWERVSTQAAARNLPDVLHFTNMQLREYASNGQLMDLGEASTKAELDLGAFDKPLVQGGEVDGKLYGVPTGSLILCTVVNTTMMNEIGVTIPGPEDTWTWDDFRQQGMIAAKKLGDRRWFTLDFGSSTRIFKAFMMGRNKQLFDIDQDPPALDFGRQDLVDWLTYWEGLRKEGIAPPPNVTAEQDGLPFEDDLFAKERVGIYLHTSNTLTNYEEYIKGDLEIRRLPNSEPATHPDDYFFSVSMAVAAASKHPAEAAILINYFMNDPEAVKLYAGEFGPSASSKARGIARKSQTTEERKVTDFTNVMLKVGVVPDQNWPRGGQQLNDQYLSRANEQVAFGKASPKAAADELFSNMESAMS